MITLQDILANFESRIIRIIGKEQDIEKPASLYNSKPNTITFCEKNKKDALQFVQECNASVVICPDESWTGQVYTENKTLVIVNNPRWLFADIVETFFSKLVPRGIYSTNLDSDVSLARYVGPNVIIEDHCKIGLNAVIYGNVHIFSGTQIGKNVIIRSGSVIGTPALAYHRMENGELRKFPQIGGVIIEDNVEIGANVVIDCGALEDTIIHSGVKIGSLVYIAHNCEIGKDSFVVAHDMLSGSVKVGERCWIAPSATAIHWTNIGNDSMVGLGAVVTKDVPDNTVMMGVPAVSSDEFKKQRKMLKELLSE